MVVRWPTLQKYVIFVWLNKIEQKSANFLRLVCVDGLAIIDSFFHLCDGKINNIFTSKAVYFNSIQINNCNIKKSGNNNIQNNHIFYAGRTYEFIMLSRGRYEFS